MSADDYIGPAGVEKLGGPWKNATPGDILGDVTRAIEQIEAQPVLCPPPVTVHHPRCQIFDKAHERGHVDLADCTCGGYAFR